MGHYGCHRDCTEKISAPLFAEGTINLIRSRPMSSLLAHTLGSTIIFEFFMVFFLGVLLLFFTCKCAILLVNERRRKSRVQSSQKQTAKTNSPDDDTTYFTGCCSTSFMLAGQASKFRQRSRRGPESEELIKEIRHSSQASGDQFLSTLMPLAIQKE